jgi:hypothetical protein
MERHAYEGGKHESVVAMVKFPRGGLIGAVTLVAACSHEPAGVEERTPPTIERASISPNGQNVLSAVVSVSVRGADSVAVRFHLADEASVTDSETAAVAVAGDSLAVPVLGLLPGRRYTLQTVAYAARAKTIGNPLEFTTDTLPSDLPRYTASGSDPTPGFVVFAAGPYGIVIDNTGRVIWYRRFPNGPGLNFIAQPTGHYVARPPTPAPGDIEPWVELDALGNETQIFGCARGLQPRFHDLIEEPDGSYWIMCDETRTMDLTAAGGASSARVTGTVVQHLSGQGSVLFDWSPFDHFAITDLDARDRMGVNVNWTHGNALDFDAAGNLIVSFRSLGEVTSIDTRTGTVLWRMGGIRNEFAFLDTPLPAFVGQHGVRVLGSGAILILDNIGSPTESRVERYVLDEGQRTARLVRSYASVPGVVTQIGGSIQPLPEGRTLVSFGTAGRVEEYDETGRVVWRIDGNAGYVFRAQRIRSLYAPGVGLPR